MNVTHVSLSPVNDDARILRSVASLRQLGHDVALIGYGAGIEPPAIDFAKKIRAALRTTPANILPEKWVEPLYWLDADNRRLHDLVIASRPDIIHAHDWPVLPAAAKVARQHGVPLIYETPEVATAQRIERRLWRICYKKYIAALEGRHIRQAAEIISVSDGISRHLKEEYEVRR